MADMTVYRSKHPDVIAAWQRWNDESLAFANAISEAKATWGLPDDAMAAYTTGRTMRVVGIKPPGGQSTSPPDGWRLDRKHWLWVPYRSRKDGKAIAKLMDSLVVDRVSSYLPGMPAEHWQGLSFRSPAVEAMAGHIWVSWSVDLDEVPNTLVKAGDDPYDRAIWERVALSEYYATRETWAEDVA